MKLEGPEKLAGLIEDELKEIPRGTLKAESILAESIELSSLNMLMIMSLIQTEYGVNLGSKRIKAAETVNDLFNQIVELLKEEESGTSSGSDG